MKKMFRKKKLFSLGFVLLVYMTIVTPLLVTHLQKQQEAKIRAEAATITAKPTMQVAAMPQTSFNTTVAIQGIGNTPSTKEIIVNKNPAHQELRITVTLYKDLNERVASGTGVLAYDPKQGNYTGTIAVPSENLTSGEYYIGASSSYRMSKVLPTLQLVTPQSSHTLPPFILSSGDIHEDNIINILDYNTILDCYKELPTLQECSVEKKLASDLNDDNTISKIDYNLFLREIARNAY